MGDIPPLADQAPDYGHWRFLVVDDGAFIRANVRGMLERCRAREVFEAADGGQARQILARQVPGASPLLEQTLSQDLSQAIAQTINCIVCDWNMHPVGGLELLRQVRAGEIDGVARATCFIMLTGHASERVVKAAIALDVDAYLVKPASFEKLTRTIDAAMAQRIALRPAAEYAVLTAPPMLPSEIRPAPWMRWMAAPSRRAQLQDQVARIRAAAASHSPGGIRNTRRELLDDVRPGLMLAEDLFADADLMVAPAGTVLSPTLLAHLKAFAAGAEDAAHLWVGDP